MKAYVLNEAGSVENLILSEIEKPELGADEVLVETKAVSINPVDVKVRPIEEVLTMIIGDERPVILGWDIAGIVAEVGSGVTGFEVGDKVFGMVNFPGHGKAYAEYVASPARHLAKMPVKFTFEEAPFETLFQKAAASLATRSDDYNIIVSDSQWLGALVEPGWIVSAASNLFAAPSSSPLAARTRPNP